jgi:PhnB protein
MIRVKPIPEGFHTITPSLILRDCAQAIEFYKSAFGATEETSRFTSPDGQRIMHAELKFGDSMVFLADEMPEQRMKSPQSLDGAAVVMSLFVPDVDAAFKRAVAAGAKAKMPLSDTFWGDRRGVIVDPFGHVWHIFTHVEDVSLEEMKTRAEKQGIAMRKAAR